MTSKEYSRAIVTISKEELNNLPTAGYAGKIVLVEDKTSLNEALEDLRKASLIGFDTETRPSFKKGQQFDVALIQLSTPQCSYLIRTNKIGFPADLISLLENPELKKIGLSIHDDFHNLRRVTDINPQGFIDLQQYVKDFKIADNSLSRVYGILFGERISKGQRLSNWEADVLTEAQQSYAAMDAFACIKIYNYLHEGNFNPRNSKYLTLPPEPLEPATSEE